LRGRVAPGLHGCKLWRFATIGRLRSTSYVAFLSVGRTTVKVGNAPLVAGGFPVPRRSGLVVGGTDGSAEFTGAGIVTAGGGGLAVSAVAEDFLLSSSGMILRLRASRVRDKREGGSPRLGLASPSRRWVRAKRPAELHHQKLNLRSGGAVVACTSPRAGRPVPHTWRSRI
jgi:hypothetical protein